jgi:hypothetical protein
MKAWPLTAHILDVGLLSCRPFSIACPFPVPGKRPILNPLTVCVVLMSYRVMGQKFTESFGYSLGRDRVELPVSAIIVSYVPVKPITVAERSKAWTVFARSNAGIVGSNLTEGKDVCVRLFCVGGVLCVGSGLATGWSLVQGVLPTVSRIKKLKKRPRSNEGLYSHREMSL